jgi:hypothetical protein
MDRAANANRALLWREFMAGTEEQLPVAEHEPVRAAV